MKTAQIRGAHACGDTEFEENVQNRLFVFDLVSQSIQKHRWFSSSEQTRPLAHRLDRNGM